jgi:Leucine-rich repeat (LRR) protein
MNTGDKVPFSLKSVKDGLALRIRAPITDAVLSAIGENLQYITEVSGWWKTEVGELGALSRLPALERLFVSNRTASSIAPINKLQNLVVLDVTSNVPFDIDLEHWPKLQELRFDWNGEFIHLEAASELGALTVHSWKERDLQLLAAFPKLEALELHGGSLRTLQGIDRCPLLRRVILSHIRSLTDFEAIATLKNLSFLTIESCRQLNGVDVFAGLPQLRGLRLDNLETLSTLAPLRISTSLEELFFIDSTNIADGVTSIVNDMQLSDFGFQNRKHYDFTYDHVRGAQAFITQRDGSTKA